MSNNLFILEVSRFIPNHKSYSLDHGTPSNCELFITNKIVQLPKNGSNIPDTTLLEKTSLMKFAGMELPWLDNANNISRIPAGIYLGTKEDHVKYGFLFRLLNVPKRTGVLFGHVGNYGGNEAKGFKSNSQGCLLIGKNHTVLSVNGKSQYSVSASTATLKILQPIIKNNKADSCIVIITDPK